MKNIKWQLEAKTLAKYTDAGENVYVNVITEIHWRVTAEVAGVRQTLYGLFILPRPTDPKSYIDLAKIQALGDRPRRDLVVGWAERLAPGFVADKLALLKGRIAEVAAQQGMGSVTIL